MCIELVSDDAIRSASWAAREDMYELGRDEFESGGVPRFSDDADYMDGWLESRDLHEMARTQFYRCRVRYTGRDRYVYRDVLAASREDASKIVMDKDRSIVEAWCVGMTPHDFKPGAGGSSI